MRDLVGPVAFLALAVLALAVVLRLRPRGPVGPLAVLFFASGALLHMVNDLAYLSLDRYWKFDGYHRRPARPH